jgi:protein TonB
MNYARQQKDPTRQAVGFLLVVLMHVGIVYALIHGLGRQAVEVLRSPLETKIIEEVKPPDVPPPPPPPKLAPPPPPFIPPPDFAVSTPPAAGAITAITHVKPPEAPPPPPPKAAEPVRVPPVVDAAHSCRQPEYPAVSKRMEETGTVVLLFLIDLDGKVTESKVEESSGHDRLDEAARQALGLCKFKPGTVDGKPEKSWARLRYTWKLQ